MSVRWYHPVGEDVKDVRDDDCCGVGGFERTVELLGLPEKWFFVQL